jgi:uncharacterized protein YbbC (DUF1343 family)
MTVQTGLETLLEEKINLLRDKQVGVIAHPASVDSHYHHILDIFRAQPEIRLTTIMGPQHGVRGETQDNMIEWESFTAPDTGLPVYSLYGETRQPTEAMLKNIDTLVIDLQDVGSRYYTFVHTMALAMEACSELGKEVVILDRPNPINGTEVEGSVLNPDFRSFVGLHPLPVRHGMTIGELASYFNGECGIDCQLEVVRLKGWKREMFFDDTGLPWVLPSPNMPSPETAMVYPGTCLLEGTNVSEGRGTTRPFEISGAPWIDPAEFARNLNQLELPGVFFRPLHFTPAFHKWAGHLIGGVQIHVLDRSVFEPFLTGVAMVKFYRDLGEGYFRWKEPPYEYEFTLLPFDILCGTNQIRKLLEAGSSVGEIADQWRGALASFLEIRRQHLLY